MANGERGFVYLRLRIEEFELLKTKLHEVATEIGQALERMAKKQKEIDRLKAETHELLKRLRAT